MTAPMASPMPAFLASRATRCASAIHTDASSLMSSVPRPTRLGCGPSGLFLRYTVGQNCDDHMAACTCDVGASSGIGILARNSSSWSSAGIPDSVCTTSSSPASLASPTRM
ncbi:hypothetical protein CDD83_7770 [Cordyceps sp. RAO-2017]|nr:hypothetical protein CDD83_7770 [Cordyceps sp. RAO-2017]